MEEYIKKVSSGLTTLVIAVKNPEKLYLIVNTLQRLVKKYKMEIINSDGTNETVLVVSMSYGKYKILEKRLEEKGYKLKPKTKIGLVYDIESISKKGEA